MCVSSGPICEQALATLIVHRHPTSHPTQWRIQKFKRVSASQKRPAKLEVKTKKSEVTIF